MENVMKSGVQNLDLINLYTLLNEEIIQYQGLIQGLKEESKYLREGQIEPLIRTVRFMEEIVNKIWETEEKVRELLKEKSPNNSSKGKTISFLEIYSLLSKEDQLKLKELRTRLNQSKEIAKRVNERNKRFAHEYLSILSEIISSIVSPPSERLIYDRPGGQKTIQPSLTSLDREV